MFCKECGAQIDDNAKFCSKCGTQQTRYTETETESRVQDKSLINEPVEFVIDKYDKLHSIQYAPIFVGVFVLIINLFFIFSDEIGTNDNDKIFLIIFSLSSRIGLAIWCNYIAKELNRDPILWVLFAVFFPVFTLIIIGFQKKHLYSKDYSSLSNLDKSTENNIIAYQYIQVNNYRTALLFANKSLLLNPQNHYTLDALGVIKYNLKDYKGALESLNKSIEINNNFGIKHYHRGHVYSKLDRSEEAIKEWRLAAKMGELKAKKELEKIKL